MLNSSILEELRPFFYPGAVAVVGVSQDPTKFGSMLFNALKRFGFKGPTYPVGPSARDFEGQEVYPSVTALPGEVDSAYICLPAQLVPAAVRECKRKNIPSVVVLSAGFSESGTPGGRQLEAELAQLSGEGLRILGPNCFGIYSPGGGVTMLPGPNFPRESGSVGLLSQSGGLSVEFSRLSSNYGIKVSQAVSYGNACDITELELLQYFEADPHTRIVAVYIEGVTRGREFFRTVNRLAPKKPLIIWKGGMTPGGAKAAASHTASLAGNAIAWTTLFRQTAAIEVYSLEELLDTASAFCHLPPKADPRVAFVCGGGGFGVAASDTCYREGLVIPPFTSEVRQKLVSLLAPIGTSANNPVDTGSPFPPARMLRDIMEIIADSGNVGSIITQVSLSPKMHKILDDIDEEYFEGERDITEVPVEIRRKWGIPILVVIREGGDTTGGLSWEAERFRIRRIYYERGIAVYPTLERALKALGRMVTYYRRREGMKVD